MIGSGGESTRTEGSIWWQSLEWLWWLCGSVAVVMAAVVLRFEPPDQIVVPILNFPLPQACWTRRWLGFNCPGCGLTRSFVLAAHGHFGQAFQMHPIGALMFGFVVIQIPVRLYQAWLFACRRPLTVTHSNHLPGRFWRGVTQLRLLAWATVAMFAWWAGSLLFG